MTASTVQSFPVLRESRQRGWLAALLFAGMVLCYAHRGALSVAAPFMMKELGLSPGTMGLLLSAFFWSYALMQVPAGWLADRFGARRIYFWGMALGGAASVMTGWIGTLGALVAVRILLGVGQAVAFPASSRAVANWFPDGERGAVTGLYLAGVRLGQAGVAAIAVWLLPLYGWKSLFVLTGVLAIAWMLPWDVFLRRWDQADRAPAPSGQARPGFWQGLGLLRRRSVLGIFLGFFAYDYVWFLYTTWLPGYLKMERGFSDREMSLYSAAPYVFMSVIILFSGMLSDALIRRGWQEVPVRKAFIVTGLLIACLIVPASLVEDKITAVWLITLSLCGLGVSAPNTWTLTQAVCDKKIVGTVSGLQNFGGNIGGVIAPALTGLLVHTTHSFMWALALTGGILLGGVAAYGLVNQRVTE